MVHLRPLGGSLLTLEVAIPDTALIDCSDLRQKTVKLGLLGRAFAVFKVDKIWLYKTEKLSQRQLRDVELIMGLLRYMDTPQYLRKRIFPKSPMLKYAGILPPLRTQSHPLGEASKPITEEDIRWGVQVRAGKIDIGLDQLVDFSESVSEREPTQFRIVKTQPRIKLEIIGHTEIGKYWGWEIRKTPSISEELEKMSQKTRIAFSRNGVDYNRIESEIKSTVSGTRAVVALFGGPRRGISKLVSRELSSLKQHVDFWVNTIPDQGTETVRLEEALLISLGILNNSVGALLSEPGYYESI
ncbi:MAG: hypothetical protein EAX81_02620 [Candidatus Thorarchaeota archaeon]|nr:hypothetical protein [Candidatus Thorarchaeota archaeon]